MAEALTAKEKERLLKLAYAAAEDAGSDKWWQSSHMQLDGEGVELSHLLCFFPDEGEPRVWHWPTVGEYIAAADPEAVIALIEENQHQAKHLRAIANSYKTMSISEKLFGGRPSVPKLIQWAVQGLGGRKA